MFAAFIVGTAYVAYQMLIAVPTILYFETFRALLP